MSYSCIALYSLTLEKLPNLNVFFFFFNFILDLYHFGSDQELRWKHHPGRLLRLNPACLAGCSHVRLCC